MTYRINKLTILNKSQNYTARIYAEKMALLKDIIENDLKIKVTEEIYSAPQIPLYQDFDDLSNGHIATITKSQLEETDFHIDYLLNIIAKAKNEVSPAHRKQLDILFKQSSIDAIFSKTPIIEKSTCKDCSIPTEEEVESHVTKSKLGYITQE